MSQAESDSFYQSSYAQGFTTELPNDIELERLKSSQFAGGEKDYTRYARILKAIGVNGSVLDFGCSWGYGSWQLRQAGLIVYSYEIGTSRAQYAEDKLGCTMLANAAKPPEKVDCFFSAHVIEHLPNPSQIFEVAAQTLKPDGKIVIFMPNGDPRRSEAKNYHKSWGLVHPNLLSEQFLKNVASKNGFTGKAFSTPFELTNEADDLSGEELLFIAHRAA